MTSYNILLFLFYYLIPAITAVTWKDVVERSLVSYQDKIYTRPTKYEEATAVRVYLNIENIEHVDSKEMSMRTKMKVKLIWEDDRVAVNRWEPNLREYLDYYIYQFYGWTPRMYIKNAIEFSDNIKSNLQHHHKKSLLLTKSFTTTTKCPMNMKSFPFDHQLCSILISSYSLLPNEVDFKWKSIGSYDDVQLSEAAFIVKDNEGTSEFDLVTPREDASCQQNHLKESCIIANLEFKRRSWIRGTFIIEGIVLVTLSWLVFAFTAVSLSCRFIYLIFCCILQCMFIYKSMEIRPLVPYMTALDTWNCICFFTVLLELLVLLRISNCTTEENEEEPKKSSWKKKICSFFCINNLTAGIFFPILYYILVGFYFTNYLFINKSG